MEVHSAGEGQGSEFIVRLPVTLARPQLPAPVPPVDPVARSLRLLVVDDNVDAAESAAMLLRIAGHQVHLAHTGPNALEAALGYHPDVVLLDIGLPEMNGYEVASRLRQHAESRDMALIAVSGYGHESDRDRSEQAGFDHYMVKPIDWPKLEELLATVSAGGGRVTR